MMPAFIARRRFTWLLAAAFTAQMAIIAACLLLLGLDMEAAQRSLLHQALAGQAGMLGALAAMLLLLLGLGLKLLFDAYLAPLAQLAEEAALLSAHPGHRTALRGAPEIRALAARLNELAAACQRVQDEGQARIDSANRSLAEEKNRLAALMADLALGVLVCNLQGRILLYNTRAAQLLDSGGADAAGSALTVGLGRSVFGAIESGLIVHALEQLQHQLRQSGQDAAHPVSRFVATLAGGQVMRMQMAPVLDTAGALNGFVLTLEDISREVEAQDRGSALLAALTQGTRAALANIRAAAETMRAFPDMDAAKRAQFTAVIEEEAQRLAERIDSVAQGHDDEADSRWRLEEMRGVDLLALLRRRMESRSLPVEQGAAPDAGLWVNVDSYALTQALASLAGRICGQGGARRLRLELRRDGRLAQLDLAWEGAAPAADLLRTWEEAPLEPGMSNGAATLKTVVARHAGDTMLLADAPGRPRWRLLLPAMEPRAALETPRQRHGRPEFYDFDLFHQPGQNAETDAQPLSQLSYTVFDTETTGLDPAGGDEIISIGALRIVNGRLLQQETFDCLVRPQRPVSAESVAIHGISDAMLKDQPDMTRVLPLFHRFVEDTVLIAHNAAFDMRFLRMLEDKAGVAFRQPVLDTLLLSQVLHPNQTEHGLEAIATRLGVAVVGRHTALGDAIVTGEVFLRMLPLLADMGITTLGQARAASQRTPYARIHY
jgi:DNA polymerase-3 subunit epsilon